MDLKEYFREIDGGSDAMQEKVRSDASEWQWRRLRMYNKPTIAMVNGWCFGGGFTPLVKESRLLAISASLNLNAALVVSRMLGLNDASGWRHEPSADLPLAWAGRCLVDPDGREWHELSLARLAADERFLAVAR